MFEKKKKKFSELGMEVRESDKNAEVGRKENNSESRIFFEHILMLMRTFRMSPDMIWAE